MIASSSLDPRRQAVLDEARSWLGTPFHHEARVKGAGVDCLMFLAEVYERANIIAHVDVPHYPPDWHLHRDWERYLEGLMGHAKEVTSPAPADVAIFKFGRAFSHGTVVVEWPRIIHAYWHAGVVAADVSIIGGPLFDREVKFFSPFGTAPITSRGRA